MTLRVLAAGTHSLLVDAGRPTTRALGVPVGGPADRAALMLGNALVGNPPFTPALEITLSGPTLVAEADVGLCVFGAPFRLDRDGEPLEPGYTFTLQKGQTLHVGGTPVGCRAYLCVPGGFRTRRVLASCTAFEPVQVGDVLKCASSRLPGRGLAINELAFGSPSPPASGGEGRTTVRRASFAACPARRPTGSTTRSTPTPTASPRRATAWASVWTARR